MLVLRAPPEKFARLRGTCRLVSGVGPLAVLSWFILRVEKLMVVSLVHLRQASIIQLSRFKVAVLHGTDRSDTCIVFASVAPGVRGHES